MENNESTNTVNLYIIDEVLSDYTSGMVVIAAENIDDAREMYSESFDDPISEFDRAIAKGSYKVVEGVNHPEGVVSYVYGGG